MPLSGLQLLNEIISELEIVVANRKVKPLETSAVEQIQVDGKLAIEKGIQRLKISSEGSSASSGAAILGGETAKSDKDTKTGKKEGDKKAAEPRTKEVVVPDELSINSLDLRVGIIRSVIRHETAEKLYCEEIDVGEDEPRPIASGLVPFYSLEQMQDRRVIVVANLLPRKLVGFKSNGMVLCASTVGIDGKELVEFIDPPASAAAGERITGFGLTSLPLSAKQCDKRKAFETLAASLVVNAEGVACWNGLPLVALSSGEVCRAPTLRDCHIH